MAEFAYYPAYRAPSLPLEKASLQNSVSLRPCPWSTAFGAGKVDLTPLPDTPGFAPACILDLDMGGTLWYAELDDAALLLRHEVFTDDAGNALISTKERCPAKCAVRSWNRCWEKRLPPCAST